MPRQKTDERRRELKQQVWQKRRKKFKIISAVIGVAIILYAAINVKKLLTAFFWNIRTFSVKEVRIIPYNARTLITGLLEIETGKSMLFLDIDGLREQIMRIREVEDCTVRKIYPSTVEINATMRKPWIMLEKGSNVFFVDRTGKILLAPENPENFLRVTGINLAENNVEEGDLWKLEVLKEIEKCYNFHNLQRYFSLGSIRILKPTEIILNDTADSRKIIVVSEDIPGRFEKLRAVLEECEKNSTEWEYIDIRFEHAYVKHKKTSEIKK